MNGDTTRRERFLPVLIGKILVALCMTGLCSSSLLQGATPDAIKPQILRLITNGSVVLHDESGKPLLSYNADAPLVPASILKIFTSLVAIDCLGKDYRFKTEFYVDDKHNLTIKGWGDPFLVSEEIEGIARELKAKGLTSLRQLFLDSSNYASPLAIPGVSRTLNPYDALNGALVTNFNSLSLEKDGGGKLHSGETVTPLTPIARLRGKVIRAGTKERINLSGDRNECLKYAGELFLAIFRRAGIAIDNENVGFLKINDGSWQLYHTHHNSRNLESVSRGLLKFSNNFIANQLFLAIGAEKSGYPATLEKGRDAVETYIRTKMNIPQDQLVVVEGSGISRNNKVTGAIMINILEKHRYLAEYLPEKNNTLVKSGTLSGVYSYAGYIKTNKGLQAFVIILNQEHNGRDKILDLLVKYSQAL